jgi:hypothetical protein
MADEISGWGDAHARIAAAVLFLCREKTGADRAEVIREVIASIHAIERESPEPQSDPLLEPDQYKRESWARMTARHTIDGALVATERLPRADQTTLLRELAKRALWHLPNARDEVRAIMKWLDLETLKRQHPHDDPPGRD